MNYETKRDVFEELLESYMYSEDIVIDEISTDGVADRLNLGNIIASTRYRYADALPDDMPVVSKDVSNIMRTYRFLWWKEFLDKAYDNELDKELSDDEDINYRVRSESAEVARALILGAWRVEETGEIVKLEEEK